jgi:hypothetical protein
MSRPSNGVARIQVNNSLEKKFAKYLLAGGAVPGAPLMAHAEVITCSGALNGTTTVGGTPIAVSFAGGPSFSLSAVNGTFDSVAGVSVNTDRSKAGNWPQDHTNAYLGFSCAASARTYTEGAQVAVDVDGGAGSNSATATLAVLRRRRATVQAN